MYHQLHLEDDMVPKITMTYAGGAVYISPGVLTDGGGIIITANGKIIHVPPWTGPIHEKELLVCTQRIRLRPQRSGNTSIVLKINWGFQFFIF